MSAASTRLLISPRARRALQRRGIDGAAIRGSGPGGRIVEADVIAHEPCGLSPMRRAIARRTSESAATIPHFHVRAEVDATELIAARSRLLDELTGVRLSVTDLILKAMGMALQETPHANRVWKQDGIENIGQVNVGMVVALDDGLLIPVMQQLTGTLTDIARQRAALSDQARSGRLPALSPPCATSLSNLGAGRVDEFQALIPLGQSSILAAGRIAPRPFVVDGILSVRSTLRLCLSVDHRVLDGRPASDFLGRIVHYLEQPAALLT
jgi:pyruvate dehydrogenase E2 component (dihydrolipoamide acetyltransferase)